MNYFILNIISEWSGGSRITNSSASSSEESMNANLNFEKDNPSHAPIDGLSNTIIILKNL